MVWVDELVVSGIAPLMMISVKRKIFGTFKSRGKCNFIYWIGPLFCCMLPRYYYWILLVQYIHFIFFINVCILICWYYLVCVVVVVVVVYERLLIERGRRSDGARII